MPLRRHLRRSSAAALTALALALPAAAQAQAVEWRGIANFTGFTAACAAQGWRGDVQMQVRYRPARIGTNGPDSYMAFFAPNFAFTLELEDRRPDARPRPIEVDAITFTDVEWTLPVRLQVTAQTPPNAALRATTPALAMTARIDGFSNIRGCSVTFDASMTRARRS